MRGMRRPFTIAGAIPAAGFWQARHAIRRSSFGTTPPACTCGPDCRSGGATRPGSALDWVVGELLKKLDGLGIADSTIVVFTSDNGAEKFSWPDGGTSPFRGEKGLGWEGGFRAPFLIRWPGKIPAGQVLNGIMSLEDMVPTIMAAAGVPDVKEQLLEGYQAGDKHFRVHLDGYNQLPYLTGEVDESPRHEFFYYGERDLYAIRYNDWKVHFQTKDDWFAGARSFNRPCPDR